MCGSTMRGCPGPWVAVILVLNFEAWKWTHFISKQISCHDSYTQLQLHDQYHKWRIQTAPEKPALRRSGWMKLDMPFYRLIPSWQRLDNLMMENSWKITQQQIMLCNGRCLKSDQGNHYDSDEVFSICRYRMKCPTSNFHSARVSCWHTWSNIFATREMWSWQH